jgi:hypothetical protein
MMSEIKRCPICKRSKNKAIQEQTAQRVGCGMTNCAFKSEIQNAIVEKPKIKVVKKLQPFIRIVRK